MSAILNAPVTTKSATVPVLDLSALQTGGSLQGLAAELRAACTDTGFFYVANHGIPSDVMDAISEAGRRYFALPLTERRQHLMDERFRRGYVPTGTSKIEGYAADDKESFDWGLDVPLDDPFVVAGKPLHGPNKWPADLPWLRQAGEAYAKETTALGRRILRVIALSLEMPENFFEGMFTKPCVTHRMLHYPPQHNPAGDQFGSPPHTDFGLLTLLLQDPIGGLEIQTRGGDWIAAPYIPNTFVINLADLMKVWTNDIYVSNYHRVVNRSGRERYSFPTFLNTDYDIVVDTIPTCITADRPRKYKPVKAGDYLLSRFRAVQNYKIESRAVSQVSSEGNGVAIVDPAVQCRLFIAGRWTDGVSRVPIVHKYSVRMCGDAHLPSREQVHLCVSAASDAFSMTSLDASQRGDILDRAADLVLKRSGVLQESLRREAGFTLRDAEGEVQRTVLTFRLAAEEARRLCGEVVPIEGAAAQAGRLGFTLRVPLGIVCAITPFNSPLNVVAHKIAPAIAAGNAVILKPSLHTPGPARLLTEILLDAGLPTGLISVLNGGPEVVQWLLDEPLVGFFAFTGSTQAGAAIQRGAGLRRTQMELGSIAHCILCADADLDVALPKIVNASYRKAGQVCTSIQYLFVHESRQSEVEKRLGELVASLKFGDPADATTYVGPVITVESAARIERWIQSAVTSGGRLLAGGGREGNVVAPTLLVADFPQAEWWKQEIFGPVLCIVPFLHLDDVIDRINASPYGLAAGIFTNKIDAAFQAARSVRVGGVHINETPSSRVDQMPFGGSKLSGFGREGPRYAIREMSEERLITIRTH